MRSQRENHRGENPAKELALGCILNLTAAGAQAVIIDDGVNDAVDFALGRFHENESVVWAEELRWGSIKRLYRQGATGARKKVLKFITTCCTISS